MEIIINRKILSGALSEVAPFVSPKAPILILKNIKVVTKGNRVKFEANNTQASVRKYVTAENIDHDGSFLVDCTDINAYIGKCKSDTITLIAEGDTLTVKHQKGKADFQIMRVEEYPDLDMPTEGVTEINLPAALLSECINVARNFVGSDDLRPMLKPIFAYVSHGEFGYCGTDTRKMVVGHSPIDVAADTDIHWYIEPCVFGAVMQACKNTDTVTVKVTPTHVSYRIGDVVIQTVQTQGRFPDFNRAIPKTWNMECAVDRDELIDSLKRTALQCEDSRLVKLDISRMDMTLTADNLEKLKRSFETMPHNGCDGEIKIGLHADYFQDCLGVCGSNEVCLRMSDASRPVLIHQPDNATTTILLMPMTITN